MNKTELIKSASTKSGVPQAETTLVLSAILEIISETLDRDEPVQLIGFGTFSVREECSARKDFNPWNQATIDIPAEKVMRFEVWKIG